MASVAGIPAWTPAALTFDPRAPLERDALALVNHYRALVGVAPLGIDRELGGGCAEHAQYLARNRGNAALVGLSVHGQDASLPGASERGVACGKAAVIDQAARDAPDAIEAWMGTLYHRAPILAPYVDRIGVGAAGPVHARAVVMAFGLRANAARSWPVAFPANGQTNVRVDFVAEVPNPIPSGTTGGYPFTLQFPPNDPLTNVRARFVDGDGARVPFYLSSAERPASIHHKQRGLVGVIPKRQLRAGTRYTVTVQAIWRGKPGTWSSTFTTMPRIAVDARDRDALFSALDKPATVRGTVVRSGRVGDGAYVLLDTAPDVVVDLRVPGRVKTGSTVEVDGTPQLYGKSTVRVESSELRVVN